jgi:hypothetical protein
MPTPTSRSRSARSNDSERYRGVRRRLPPGSRKLVIFLVLALVAGAALIGLATSPLGARLTSSGQPVAAADLIPPDRTTPPPAAAPRAGAPRAGTPGTSGAAKPSDPPLLRLPGPVPSSGENTFEHASGVGEVVGRAGTLRRYRVTMETGANEDVAAFATEVERALAAPGSWIGSGQLRLQRVPNGANHDFTVYLATRNTARHMCAAGGTDIRIDGVPYTSCRAPGKVIINLDRWRLSVDHLVKAKVPLSTYRLYVINHEVGHQLGYSHEQCPDEGEPAPVMMQQTLFLNGCVVNPWPYLNGRRYAGPKL